MTALIFVSTEVHASSPAPVKKKLKVSSSLFKDKAKLPDSAVFKGMGCTGENISPDLKWEGAPEGTKSFAVILHDPDAPTGTGFYHWTLWNIPVTVTSLEPGSKGPAGSVQGYTDFGMQGYNGACPPPGDKPHRYEFKVFALDVEKLDADKGATAAMVRFMMNGHTLAEGMTTASWSR